MKVYDMTIDDLFGKEVVYEVPIYQRLYVWNQENHWQPIWEDMERMAKGFVADDEPRIHFLGASVQQITDPPSRSVIVTNLVIDGQQRLTTLQILLKAFRDVVKEHNPEYYKKLDELINNKDKKGEAPFKILSTISNRKHFSSVMKCENKESLLKACGYFKEKEAKSDNILMAYFFFYDSIHEWLGESKEDKKIASLYKAITENAKIAIIYIDDKEDDAQTIFEKLNTGGKPLLASDLIKNSLLMELHKSGMNPEKIEEIYSDYWQYFDDGENFWQKEVRGGPGPERARIEVYLKHVLALLTDKEVSPDRLYKTYRSYVESGEADSASYRMQEFHKFGKIYERMQREEGYGNPAIESFLERLHAMDGNPAYPFLLKLFDKLKGQPEKLMHVLEDLESFLVRRKICGLSTKNYNSFFVDILDTLEGEPDNMPITVRDRLLSGDRDTNKWPDNDLFQKAWMDEPLGKKIKSSIGIILKALEEELRKEYPEGDISKRLTVEHIMPQKWHPADWPLPTGIIEIEARFKREVILHTVGNLTLLTNRMNAEQSNKPWIDPDDPAGGKKALLEKSTLILNKRLCRIFDDKWDEETIRERSDMLFPIALKIWPRPE